MNADIYDALRAAKVDEALARRAASSVVDQPSELRDVQRDVAEIKATLKLHGWILSAQVALSIAILARLLFVPV